MFTFPVGFMGSTPTISLNPIATDDNISVIERLTALTISGSTSYIANGTTITVNIDGINRTTTVTNDNWSVNIPETDIRVWETIEVVTASVIKSSITYTDTRTITVEPATITMNPVATDNNVSVTERLSPIIVSGTTTGVPNTASITVTVDSVGISSTVSNNSWSVSIPAANIRTWESTEDVVALISSVNNLTATQTITVEPATITINPVATDDYVSVTERLSPIIVSGTTTGVPDGTSITVTIDGVSVSGTVNSSAWSISIPAANTLSWESTEDVVALISSVNNLTATRSITVEPATITINPITEDDYISVTDRLSTITISGTTTGIPNGTVLAIAVDEVGGINNPTVTNSAWYGSIGTQNIALWESSEVITVSIFSLVTPILPATRSITVEPAIITMNAIATDNYVSVTERLSPIIVSGTTTGVPNNTSISVTIDGVTVSGTVSNNAWSVSIPAANTRSWESTEDVVALISSVNNLSTTQTINVEPATITMNPVATDDYVSDIERLSPIIVSGTTTGVPDGTSITVTVDGVGVSGTVTSSTWSISIPAANTVTWESTEDVVALISSVNGVVPTGISTSRPITVEAPTLTISPIATNNNFSVAERVATGANLTVSGTTTGVPNGTSITVTIKSVNYSGTVNSGTWSVSVSQANFNNWSANETATAVISSVNNLTAIPVPFVVEIPTFTMNMIATNDDISLSELDSDLVITGTTNAPNSVPVTVNIDNVNYTGTIVDGVWSATLTPANMSVWQSSESVTASITIAGRVYSAVRAVTVTQVLTINTFVSDNVLSATEKLVDQTLSGTTAGIADGEIVNISVSPTTYTTTAVVSGNTWSVVIPTATLQTWTANQVLSASVNKNSIVYIRQINVESLPADLVFYAQFVNDNFAINYNIQDMSQSCSASITSGQTGATLLNGTLRVNFQNGSPILSIPANPNHATLYTSKYAVEMYIRISNMAVNTNIHLFSLGSASSNIKITVDCTANGLVFYSWRGANYSRNSWSGTAQNVWHLLRSDYIPPSTVPSMFVNNLYAELGSSGGGYPEPTTQPNLNFFSPKTSNSALVEIDYIKVFK